jgi:hypothetical protein
MITVIQYCCQTNRAPLALEWPAGCVKGAESKPSGPNSGPFETQGEPELQGGLAMLSEGLRSPVAVEGEAGEDQ